MKKTNKLFACGASVLFATALGLQAQTTSGSAGASSTSNAGTSGSSINGSNSNASSLNNSNQSNQSSPSSSNQSSLNSGSSTSQSGSQFGSTGSNSSMGSTSSTTPSQSANQSTSGSFNGSASGSAAGSLSGSASTSSSMQSQANQSTSPSITYPATGTTTQSTYANTANSANANVANSTNTTTTQNFFSGAATSDAQVTTFVQQLDTQGPAVVQRISTQVGDLACSNDTIENLVNALHSGQTVTINANGKSATFNPQGAHLGYGEAYIALALAAQELRNAGITSCATPEQWNAVLLGGPLNVSQTSSGTNTYASASSSNTVQGIVTLHNQGQGWGQIAQSSNLQLGQIVSGSAVSSTDSTSTSPSPTGFSSAEMNRDHNAIDSDNGNHKGEKKHHWWNREKKADKDEAKDANSASDNNGGFSSSHADTSGNANSSANSTSTSSTK